MWNQKINLTTYRRFSMTTYAEAEVDEDIIADAEIKKGIDKEVVLASEAFIGAAYTDAATALLAAELIDEANAEAVAAVIAEAYSAE